MFERLFPKPEFIDLTRKTDRKRTLIIEILMFIAVFAVASGIQSIVMTIPTIVYVLTSGVFDGLETVITDGNIDGTVDYINRVAAIMSDMPGWFMLIQLFSTALVILVVILFCKLLQKRSLASMGFAKKGAAKEYLLGFAVGAAMFAAAVGFCALTGTLEITGVSPEASIGLILLFLLGYLVQGMSEEILLRGYFMPSIARKNRIWVAVLVNAAAFAMLHLGNPGMTLLSFINLTLFGIFASVYMLKRGNIWGIAALHSAWNFVQGNVFGIQVSGMKTDAAIFSSAIGGSAVINGGSFGLEGGLGVTIVLIIATVAVSFTKSKNTAVSTAE